ETESEVVEIFLGERGNAEDGARDIDALVLAEQSAVHDIAFDVRALDRAYAQLDLAIGKKDARAGLHVLGEGAEGGGEGSFVADDVARGDDDLAAGLQENGIVILELAGADLGALEIL